jgi:hypothetical protein
MIHVFQGIRVPMGCMFYDPSDKSDPYGPCFPRDPVFVGGVLYEPSFPGDPVICGMSAL